MSKPPATTKTPPKPAAKPAAAKQPPAAAAAAPGDEAPAPKKRSRIKLALFVLAPLLVLGGGGYAGWLYFLAPAGGHGETAGDGHGEDAAHAADGHAADPVTTAAVLPDSRAEVSATHSYAVSVLIAAKCGAPDAPALKAASEVEAAADGLLVSASWMAAARRTRDLSAKNCGFFWKEIEAAEWKLGEGAAPAEKPAAH
jgi:hypothetical protein